MRLKQRDLKEIYLEPRIKIEQECIESDEEERYSYGSPVLLMCNLKSVKNSISNESIGDKNIGSVEFLYQGEVVIKKGDRMIRNITEHEKRIYVVDDIIHHSSHVWGLLREE